MSDREPKRTWTQAQIGTVERANPLFRRPGDTSNQPTPKLIESRIEFKREAALVANPDCQYTREDYEATARKALWRSIHEGLDDALFEILLNIRRAHAGLSPVDPARTYLHEAAVRLQVLIDHVLGNEQPIGKDGWADVKLPESLKPRTQESSDGLHGTGPGLRIPD